MTETKLKSGNSFRTEIQMGSHTLIADEPASAGGNDEGPTPYDLLAAALGACTSMTLHFYAKREKIPLDGVELTVRNQRQHAEDCAECTAKSGHIHRFDVKIRLVGSLTEEQRLKLLEIAHRCPVYKTLTSEIAIHEELVV